MSKAAMRAPGRRVGDGAGYVLTDAQYVYFADVGTVDTTPDVDTSTGDGAVYRVAK